MIDDTACPYCELWEEEIGYMYIKTEEGKLAPLIRHHYGEKIPEDIIIDLAGLDIGTSIKISSVKLENDVTPTITDRDFVIATVAAPTVIKEPEKPAEAEAAEGAEGEAGAEGTEAAAATGKEGEAAKKDDKGKESAGEKKPAGDKKPAEKK